MSGDTQHPLEAYLIKNKWNYSEAGQRFGCADTTIARIIKGNRPPNKALMQRMIDVSKGELLPNDFYKLPASPKPSAA
ncbi:hypothetical protein [uncultured Cohaesibacter sp.]|uniref:hypothetical protein n=1 Tax=uncultured Cohaesibacter sp. TaxID=1002546 RepID=UPI0029C9977F|nr:hypothetical protein [uncultured Cohaesibacter sp.]